MAKDGGGNDRLGWAVSLAENYTIAGAPGDDDEKGAAVVFKYSKGTHASFQNNHAVGKTYRPISFEASV